MMLKGFGSRVPLRPFPMKILYRRELHKTTPTNFLYHVRLTYWLPLQLLWAELYLNLKGTQMGSPPVEHRSFIMLFHSSIHFNHNFIRHLYYNTSGIRIGGVQKD